MSYPPFAVWPPVSVSALGITSSDVTNLSGVAGATVTDALNNLALALLAIGRPTSSNKIMAGSVTTADFQQACATVVASTPQGYVAVAMNGVLQSVGNGVRTESCYFSGDGGATARAFGAIVAGDLLYWVGSVAGVQVAASDQFDFYYNAA